MAPKKKNISVGVKSFFLICGIVFPLVIQGQIVTSGKITYERRTNLLKKFDDPRMAKRIPEDKKTD